MFTRRSNQVVSTLVWVAPLTLCGCSAAGLFGSPLARFDQDQADAGVAAVRQAATVPGLVASVALPDAGPVSGASGVRKIQTNDPVRQDDLFHLGSVAKSFTATICASLVDEGLLSWTSRAADVIPGLSEVINPGYQDVTLEQWLRMQGGIREYGDDTELAPIFDLPGDLPTQRRQAALFFLSQPPDSAIGEERYSNASYLIAAAMAEQASGQSWEALLEQRVMSRLGITRYVLGWPEEFSAEQPAPHRRVGLGQFEQINGLDPAQQLPNVIAPVGDLAMSVPDLCRYAQAHLIGLQGGQSPLGLQVETIRLMHDARGRFFGIGWVDAGQSLSGVGLDGVTAFGGSAQVFNALVLVSASDGFAAAAVMNTDLDESAEDPTPSLTVLLEAVQAVVSALNIPGQ